jgi:hypothetical protein
VAYLFRSARDDNLDRTVEQGRLRSSFIYLANAVNDLRGHWALLAMVLGPLVLAGSLCLLPDAINLQHNLVDRFEIPHAQSVAFTPAQTPYNPPHEESKPPFPFWMVLTLHLLLLPITFMVNLLSMCALKHMRQGIKRASPLADALAIYRHAIPLVPSFFLIMFLQALSTVVGFVLLVIPGLLAFVWLYFSQYALVFDNLRSWPALLHSRDLIRGRFVKVATRIVVFLAVWSGFNSWAGGVFVVVSFLLGPIGYFAGRLWAAIFVVDFLTVAVGYATTAFFFAAGVRLYEDLNEIVRSHVGAGAGTENLPTAPLREASA